MLLTHELNKGTWYEIQQPTIEDIKILEKQFPFFHPTHLEDSMQRVKRAKLDLTDNYCFVQATIPTNFSMVAIAKNFELSLFLTENAIVTITPETSPVLQQERSETELIANITLPENPQLLAYRFFETLYDTSYKALDKIGEAINQIDQNILDVTGSGIIRNISIMSRNIIYFTTTLESSIPYFETLENKNISFSQISMKEYWGDIVDKLHQQQDLLEDYEKLLSKLAKAHENLLTHHTNEIIKVLTVFSVILLPLNLIASIFGMNFIHIPGAGNSLGFFITILGMGLLSAILYSIFKLKKLI